jgi:hypothetical protein
MTKHRGTTFGLAGAAIALWAAGIVIYSRSDRDQTAPGWVVERCHDGAAQQHDERPLLLRKAEGADLSRPIEALDAGEIIQQPWQIGTHYVSLGRRWPSAA